MKKGNIFLLRLPLLMFFFAIFVGCTKEETEVRVAATINGKQYQECREYSMFYDTGPQIIEMDKKSSILYFYPSLFPIDNEGPYYDLDFYLLTDSGKLESGSHYNIKYDKSFDGNYMYADSIISKISYKKEKSQMTKNEGIVLLDESRRTPHTSLEGDFYIEDIDSKTSYCTGTYILKTREDSLPLFIIKGHFKALIWNLYKKNRI